MFLQLFVVNKSGGLIYNQVRRLGGKHTSGPRVVVVVTPHFFCCSAVSMLGFTKDCLKRKRVLGQLITNS